MIEHFLPTTARVVAFAALVALPSTVQGQATPAVATGGNQVLTLGEPLVGAVGGVAVDGLGRIYVADFGETVYKITPDGRVSVFATGLYGASGNAIDAGGNLFQANFNGNYLTRIDRHGNQSIYAEGLQGPVGVAADRTSGTLYVLNCQGNTISRITPTEDPRVGVVSEFARSDLLNCPNGVTLAPDGNLYVVNFSDGLMVKVAPDGGITEFATIPGGGNGHVAFARGNLYATSFQGQRVYKVSLAGIVEHLAGTGAIGEKDGPALEAVFSFPNGIAASPRGDRLYINDYLNRSAPTVAIPPTPRSAVRVVKLASIADEMSAALSTAGIAAMVEIHTRWKADPATSAIFTEVEMNALGYQLMAQGRNDAALEVFKLNVLDYPNSWNAWDSLGEAHMTMGNDELAIENYEKSLAINPGNTNGQTQLEALRARQSGS